MDEHGGILAAPGRRAVIAVIRARQENDRNGIFILTYRIEKHIIPGMFGSCVRTLPNLNGSGSSSATCRLLISCATTVPILPWRARLDASRPDAEI